MKVKELIEQLKKCDPNAVVCINGDAIDYIHELPGYYDGKYNEVIRDESGDNESFVISSKGTKVVVKTYDLGDFLINDTDGEVVIDVEHDEAEIKEAVEDLRIQAREIHEGIRDEFSETNIWWLK